MPNMLVVFVHGWSVTHTDTYGELPTRLQKDSAAAGVPIDIAHVRLGEYVSFRDEIRVEDIARAFEAAIRDLLQKTPGVSRFACITHSTGGPVVREWLDRFYVKTGSLGQCPMSHLVMLAPANFGSALAQLGKSRLSRIKNWFDGVEPGQRVLDWLELASPEACRLNLDWIHGYQDINGNGKGAPVFLFTLTGDRVDRKLYDHVNAYTGEIASDGVVRVAAANLNAHHVILRQPPLDPALSMDANKEALGTLKITGIASSVRTAFKIIPDRSHSNKDMGIMRSVGKTGQHPTPREILRCLQVGDAAGYAALCDQFDAENAARQAPDQRVEVEEIKLWPDRTYIQDPHAMIILRVFDDQGAHVADEVDLMLGAGKQNDPNGLPSGFLQDRQGNRRDPCAVTLFLNHAVLNGCPAIIKDGEEIRPELPQRAPYGLRVKPRAVDNFVEYWPTQIAGETKGILKYICPNQTTIIDIHLTRIVHRGVFKFAETLKARSFKKDPPGGVI